MKSNLNEKQKKNSITFSNCTRTNKQIQKENNISSDRENLIAQTSQNKRKNI